MQEIADTIDIKGHQQVWSIGFFDKKTGSGVGVIEQLAKELKKPIT